MFTRLCICLFTYASLSVLPGYASNNQAADSQQHAAGRNDHDKKSDDDDHNMEDPPHVGMTKAQVRAKYGDPKERNVTDEGESWIYRLNLGEAALRGLNPFDVAGARVRFGHIFFGANGRVKRFQWDAGDH